MRLGEAWLQGDSPLVGSDSLRFAPGVPEGVAEIRVIGRILR